MQYYGRKMNFVHEVQDFDESWGLREIQTAVNYNNLTRHVCR
jgi:hypothetical protein